MKNYLWSPSKNAFIPAGMVEDYRNAGWDIDELIPVDNAVFAEYSAMAPDGKIRGISADGLPEWVDAPLLFVLGAVNQFAKEKIEQDLAMKQANYLDDLKRENTRVEGLYRDLMHVRSNYNFLLNNLRDIERTGDIRSYKKDLVDLYVNRDQHSFSTQVTDLDNIQNPSIHSLLSSKYHEAQMYRLNIHAEIPDPVTNNYLTDLDLAVVLGHLMDNAIGGARKASEGFISLAYFDEEDCQSFIIESTIADEQVPLSMMSTQTPHPGGGIGVNAVQDILERYPNTSFSVRSQNHKMMQILEMRP